jgi:hypothetical protein
VTYDEALAAIRTGKVHTSLCGLNVNVGGVDVPLTDEQFEEVWDVMDETFGSDDSLIAAQTEREAATPDTGTAA